MNNKSYPDMIFNYNKVTFSFYGGGTYIQNMHLKNDYINQ